MFKKLEKSIIYILDKYGNKMSGDFKLKENIYQNRKIISLYLNDVRISSRDGKVFYQCPNCGNKVLILLKRFVSKKSILCWKCREKENDKRVKHSLIMKNKKYSETKKDDPKKIEWNEQDLIKKSLKCWICEDINFKEDYMKRILSTKEFMKIKNKIIVNNKIVVDGEYFEHLLIGNQFKYAPFIKSDDKLFSCSEYSGNIKFICDSCGKIFISRNFKKKLQDKKILCKDCIFCNKIFKVKYTKNIIGDKIKYQSNMEKEFINYCNSNDIIIENGPKVLYFFNKKMRTYSIDFKIGDILIETKDNHVWHKKEIETGKWEKKYNSAKKYCNDNNMSYFLIFPNDMEKFKQSLS